MARVHIPALIALGVVLPFGCSLLFNGDDLRKHPGAALDQGVDDGVPSGDLAGVDDLAGLDLVGLDLAGTGGDGGTEMGKRTFGLKGPVASFFNGGDALVNFALADVDTTLGLDLIAMDSTTSRILVLSAKTDGTFTTPTQGPILCNGTLGSVEFALANLDATGREDIAMLCDGDIEIYYWTAPATAATSPYPTIGVTIPSTSLFAKKISVGNFDGANDKDIIITNPNASPTSVDVFLSTGTHTYGGASNYVTSGHPIAIAVGDLDGSGDGADDVVIAQTSPFAGATAFLNKIGGGNQFVMPKQLTGSGTPTAVAFGQLDGKNGADVAVLNVTEVNMNDISLFLGTTSVGTFASELRPTAFAGGNDLALRDLDLDGILDLVVVDDNATPEHLTVSLGNGDGTFQPGKVFPLGYVPGSMTTMISGTALQVRIGDIDGDTYPDIVVGTSTGIVVVFFNDTK